MYDSYSDCSHIYFNSKTSRPEMRNRNVTKYSLWVTNEPFRDNMTLYTSSFLG